MEAAGRALAEVAAQAATSNRAAIVCGKGNNGGDGLVAARALRETGFEVDALLLAPPDELSADSQANAARFDGARLLDPSELAGAMRGTGVVVDAVFGTGFAGQPPRPGRRRRSRRSTRSTLRWSQRTSPPASNASTGRSRARPSRPTSP